jgi:hypothetical protein
MDRPDSIPLSVIVADNDPTGSALKIVNAFKATVDFPVYYAVEKRQGIPCARNNILRQASRLGITDLAFVDDDEYVDAGWLVTLWQRYISSGADVMSGYVTTVYPPGTPSWIKKGNFFQNPRRQSDTPLMSAATGNVVFNLKKLAGEWGLAFDERFGRSGGSDSDFFSRAAQHGAVIQWTEDAVVYESLAEERMRLSYLLKNRFRKSNLKPGYVGLSPAKKKELFFVLVKKLGHCLLVLPLSVFSGFSAFVAALSRTVAAAANLMALLGWRIKWDEYHNASKKK